MSKFISFFFYGWGEVVVAVCKGNFAYYEDCGGQRSGCTKATYVFR